MELCIRDAALTASFFSYEDGVERMDKMYWLLFFTHLKDIKL